MQRYSKYFTFIALGLLVMLAVLHLSLFLQLSEDNTRSRISVLATYQRINMLEGLVSKMKDIETAQRGFLLTGDAKYLEPYYWALGKKQEVADEEGVVNDNITIDALLKALKESYSKPVQKKQIEELYTLVEDKIAYTEKIIDLRMRGGPAEKLNGMPYGKNIMDHIRERVNEMVQQEEEELKRHLSLDKKSSQQFMDLVSISSLLLYPVLGLFIIISSRQIVRLRQSQQKLRESIESFTAAAEGNMDAFFLLKAVRDEERKIIDFQFEYANPRAEKFTGLARGEIIGKSFVELFPASIPNGFFDKYVEVMLRKEGIEEEVYLDEPILNARWVRHQITPISGGVAIATRSIDERKSTEEKNRALSLALENAAEGIACLDTAGDYLTVNYAYATMLQCRPEELIGKQWRGTIHPEDAQVVDGLFAYLEKNRKAETEVRAIRKDGSIFYQHLIMVATFNAHNGAFTGCYCFTRDITERKSNEAALKHSEEKLRLFVQNVPAAVAMFDKELCYITASDRWMQDYELEGFPITGHSFFENFPKIGDEKYWKSIHARCLSGTIEKCNKDKFERKNGTMEYVRWECYPWYYVSGEIGGIVIFTEIITHTTMLQQQLKEYVNRMEWKNFELESIKNDLEVADTLQKAILDGSNYSIISTDCSGTIETFNRSAEKMLGYRKEEIIGLSTPARFHDPAELAEAALRLEKDYDISYPSDGFVSQGISPDFLTLTALVDKNGEEEREWNYIRKDGTNIPVLLSVTPLTNETGERTGYLFIASDITERKAVERMKNEFVSTVSHELRTPLTSIRGSLGLVAGGISGELPEKAKNLIQIAYTNCERLVRLINDILDMEKIESGKMQFMIEQYEAITIAKQAIEANQGFADKYGVKLEIAEPFFNAAIAVDMDRMMQILTNLISNAVKFSPESSAVRISSVNHEGMVQIAVTDQGPGISQEFTGRIFQKFAQADSSDSRLKGGTGLGLSIVKIITEKMGGTVGFTTEIGKGSTFYIEFPLALCLLEGKKPGAATLSREPRAHAHILICEDAEEIALEISQILTAEGYNFDIARSANEAKSLLGEKHYDAMTLDLLMPEAEGVAFIRELRSLEHTASMPIIVISSEAEKGKRELSGEAIGIIDWIDTPYNPDRLARAIRQVKVRSGHPLILHVEDDYDIFKVMSFTVQDVAELIHAPNLEEAKELLARYHFDLIILDIVLPDGDGSMLIEWLAGQVEYATIPIVIFSAGETPYDINRKVAASLVKSKSSGAKIVEVVKSLIEKANYAEAD